KYRSMRFPDSQAIIWFISGSTENGDNRTVDGQRILSVGIVAEDEHDCLKPLCHGSMNSMRNSVSDLDFYSHTNYDFGRSGFRHCV
ncbi:hypothetical protein L9F63_015511, partial [Diploptera punctata]